MSARKTTPSRIVTFTPCSTVTSSGAKALPVAATAAIAKNNLFIPPPSINQSGTIF
jgi:hypothetical protein